MSSNVLWTVRLLSCLFALPGLNVPAATQEFYLENGLKVIVKEDHRAPVVVSQLWYKVGSSYEPEGITGVSHALEHMMFKGTERHPGGEFARIVAQNGGRQNAFTGRDITAYHQVLEKARLELSFELEADRMRNLLLPEKEFAKEKNVVMEERRLRVEDNPRSLTQEYFRAAAFTNSPYRTPVIGWMSDIENLQVDDLLAWYRRWYAPNNAVLVVVGDIDPREVLTLARKHFGAIEPRALEPPKPRSEPPQRGMRRIQVRAPAQLPYLVMGYKTPAVGSAAQDWEPYALEVLAWVLDGGESARLARELVRGSQVAASTSVGYQPYSRLPGMLTLSGIPAQGRDAAALEAALRGQVRRLRQEPVTPAELARVKAQAVANAVFERDSIFYQAMQIGQLEAMGLDWRLADAHADRIQAVSAEQVQAVARKYLVEQRLTVAFLEPQSAGQEAAHAR